MNYTIQEVEGIGPMHTKKLKAAGVTSTEGLLVRAKNPAGRRLLAKETGIKEDKIRGWANRFDLMRIRGIGEEYAELLGRSGVDTVKELRKRKPENLYRTVSDANEKKKMVKRIPTLSHIEKWVAQAKELKLVVVT